ncbi:toxin-activating lysine-acyltransferase [Sphingobium mellinum]|uniref:toxin-activating lysine-acyltransferase n=1 Tax=Sphingobium mellinum TaxID=1387166 RepID=UPI0030EC8767
MNRKIEQLGLATKLVSESAFHRNRPPIFIFNSIIMPAIEHGNIHFAFSGGGDPIAYWIWAYLAPDVEQRLLKNPHDVLHISEWNEGENLWFLDFCAPHGHLSDIILFIRSEMFRGIDRARSLKFAKFGGIRKVSVWRRASSLQRRYPRSSRALPLNAFSSTQTEYQGNLDF